MNNDNKTEEHRCLKCKKKLIDEKIPLCLRCRIETKDNALKSIGSIAAVTGIVKFMKKK